MLVYHHVGKNMHTWKHKRNFIAHFPSGESCVSQLFYYSLMNLYQTCACSWERTKLIISSLTLSHHVFFGHPMCSSGKSMHYKFQRFAIEDLVKPGLQLWKTSLHFQFPCESSILFLHLSQKTTCEDKWHWKIFSKTLKKTKWLNKNRK